MKQIERLIRDAHSQGWKCRVSRKGDRAHAERVLPGWNEKITVHADAKTGKVTGVERLLRETVPADSANNVENIFKGWIGS